MRAAHPLTGQGPAQQGEAGIKQQTQQQERHDQKTDLRRVKPRRRHRQHRHHEAGELAADIAHENTRRRQVEGQKAEETGGQKQRCGIDEPGALTGRDQRQGEGGHQHDRGHQRIAAIHEIHRIGAAQNPEQRQAHAEPAELHLAQDRHRQALQHQARGHGHHGGRALRRQFDHEAKIPRVIGQRHPGHGERGQDDTQKLHGHQPGDIGNAEEHQHADHEGHHHPHTAAFGRGMQMRLAGIGVVQNGKADHQSHATGGDQGEEKRETQMGENG